MRAARVVLAGSLSLTAAFAGLVSVADVALAAPVTRYVAPNGTDGDNNCTAKADPCKTITAAVAAAAAGDTVQIAKGTYAESVPVTKSLTLQGDPAGGTKLVGTTNSPALLLGGPVSDDPPAVELNDLDISGNGTQPGVVALNAAVRVSDSHLDRNAAGLLGLGSLVVVSDSTASNNALEGGTNEGFAGAGVVVLGGAVRIERSTLSNNQSGGVVIQNGLTSDLTAAAAPATDADSSIVDSTLSGNGILGVGSFAGSLDIDSSTVSGNASLGVYARQAAVTVRNSTVALTRNVPINQPGAPQTAAGLYNDTSSPQQPEARSAPLGTLGATASKFTFGKRTISLKAAPKRKVAAAPIGITVSGTALVQTGTVADCVEVTDAGYNSSADATNSCGFSSARNDLVRTNPRLGALADNGGPTRTHLPLAGSPLIDRIPAGAADCVRGATDQRGVARPQGPRCDIGAVEVVSPVRITTKSLPDGQVGDKYRKQLTATGGDGDYAWSLAAGSTLPDGLRLSRDGVISGTPTESGRFTITVLADGASKRFVLVIDEDGAGPNGNNQDPIAETGAPSGQLLGWGSALVLAGFMVLVAAGHVGRRPGRHRSA